MINALRVIYNDNIRELRTYPKITAWAELGWSAKENKKYKNFEQRMDNQLVRLVGIVRNTVKKYLSRLTESELDFESTLSLSDLDLQSLLQDKPIVAVSDKQEILESLLPVYCKGLKRKGVTREIFH